MSTVAQPTRDSVPEPDRLDRLEAAVGKLEQQKRGWDIVAVFMPLVQALILAALTFYLTDRITTALNREELDLTQVKEMRELLIQLQTTQNTQEIDAAALTLSAWGKHAVSPLINIVQSAHVRSLLNQATAAENALRAVAIADPDVVCQALEDVLAKRPRAFHWGTHIAAITLLGDLRCTEAVPTLVSYAESLHKAPSEQMVEQVQRNVAPSWPVTETAAHRLKETLTRTVTLLAE